MSNLQRGADIPVRHSEGNGIAEGGLENPPSAMPSKILIMVDSPLIKPMADSTVSMNALQQQ